MSTKNKLDQHDALDYLENIDNSSDEPDKEDSVHPDEENNVIRIGELVFLPSTSTERRDTDESESNPILLYRNQVLARVSKHFFCWKTTVVFFEDNVFSYT